MGLSPCSAGCGSAAGSRGVVRGGGHGDLLLHVSLLCALCLLSTRKAPASSGMSSPTSHTSTLGCCQPELGVPDHHVQEVPKQEAASQWAETIWEVMRATPVSPSLPMHPGKPSRWPHLAAHVPREHLQPHAGSSGPGGLWGWWQPAPW